MKIVVISAIVILITGLLFFIIKPDYKSAFEADQQCHFEISSAVAVNPILECDHDTETRQWLLFYAGEADQPAKVIKRFKY